MTKRLGKIRVGYCYGVINALSSDYFWKEEAETMSMQFLNSDSRVWPNSWHGAQADVGGKTELAKI